VLDEMSEAHVDWKTSRRGVVVIAGAILIAATAITVALVDGR
jgi:hypothetical protein